MKAQLELNKVPAVPLYFFNSFELFLFPILIFPMLHLQHEKVASMMKMVRKIKEGETMIENEMENYLFHHPCIGFLLAVVGMPIFILLVVGLLTAVVMLPVSYFMGWM